MKPETAAALKQIDKRGFLDIDLDPTLDLFAAIERLKKEKNAVLLAHYYQEPDIQDVFPWIFWKAEEDNYRSVNIRLSDPGSPLFWKDSEF